MIPEELKKEKITRFLSDKTMSLSVREVLQECFLEPKPNCDVNVQAAAFLAVGLLKEAWKKLEQFNTEVENKEVSRVNKGL